jgi:hypothetical protein
VWNVTSLRLTSHRCFMRTFEMRVGGLPIPSQGPDDKMIMAFALWRRWSESSVWYIFVHALQTPPAPPQEGITNKSHQQESKCLI